MNRSRAIKSVAILGILVIWEVVAFLRWVDPIILPAPSSILRAFAETKNELVSALATTFAEVIVAIAISWICGVAAGVLIGARATTYDIFAPIVSATFAVPKVMWYPLILAWAGIGSGSKISFAILGGFLSIALTTAESVAALDKTLIPAVQSFGASKLQIFVRVLVPLALPGIVSGLRIGTALIVISVIVAEMLASFNGLGYLISYYKTTFDTPKVFLAIGFALAFTMGINAALSVIERRFGSWRIPESG